MAEEKRVKLGVDIGELSNQLIQLNNSIEQNYQKAIQGQNEYNKIIEQSIELLTQQVDIIKQIGDQNQIISPIGGGIPTSQPIGGGDGDKDDFQKDALKDIVEGVDSIFEYLQSLATPIPVEVVNGPLKVSLTQQEGTGQPSSGSGNGSGGGNNNNQNNPNNNNQGGGGAYFGAAFNTAARSFSDPNYLMAGLAGMIPVVGVGLSGLLGGMIKDAEQRVRARASFRGITGGNLAFGSLHELGYSDAEAYQREAAFYRANMGFNIHDLRFEKGFGLSGGLMNSLLRAMRNDLISNRFGYSSSELGANYLSFLGNTGGIGAQKVRAYSEDYLKILIDLTQQQLETAGETNALINSEVVANIAKVSDKFGDPTVLSRVVQGIQGGLMQAPSTQAEALQYWALSQVNPEASIWQMQLMKENPFAEGMGYFARYLETLMQTGNKNDVRFNVWGAFPQLKANQVEALLSGIESAQQAATKEGRRFDLLKYFETSEGADLITSLNLDARNLIAKEAGAATSETEVLLAKTTDILADGGEKILNLTNTVVNKVDEVVETFKEYMGADSLSEAIAMALRKWGASLGTTTPGWSPIAGAVPPNANPSTPNANK